MREVSSIPQSCGSHSTASATKVLRTRMGMSLICAWSAQRARIASWSMTRHNFWILLAWLPGTIEACDSDNGRTDAASGFEPKSVTRSDQDGLSSRAPCYCFPSGPKCYSDPWMDIPQDAPDDVAPCPASEGCFANSSWYRYGFDSPRGRCLRFCFHTFARPTQEIRTPEFAPYLHMDCANGEQCSLVDIDVGFEGIARGSVGMCVSDPAWNLPPGTP